MKKNQKRKNKNRTERTHRSRAVRTDVLASLKRAASFVQQSYSSSNQQTRQSEQSPPALDHLRRGIEVSQDVFWDWDIERDIFWRHESFFRQFRHEGKLLTRGFDSFRDLIHPRDRVRVSSSLQKAIDKKAETWLETYRLRCGDGSYTFVLDRAMILYDDRWKATHVAGVTRDITDQHEQEEILQERTNNLELEVYQQTRELTIIKEELETLSYSIGHDLRGPLRAISGFSKAILDDNIAELKPQAKQYLEIIGSNALKMGKLIDDLLLYSRLSRATLGQVPINIEQMVADILEAEEAKSHHRSVTMIVGEIPPLTGDPILVRHALNQLISNAFKFTRGRDKPLIEVGSYLERNEQIIFVRDNGIGFPPQYSKNLFRVFHRLHTDEEFEGTGIGLAIVYLAALRHHGRVWAESEQGVGSTFSLALPLPKNPPVIPTVPNAKAKPDGEKPRSSDMPGAKTEKFGKLRL